jgi:T-complex protein 1 subunit beta
MCRQLIYNFPEELFADAGILAIEHADFEGIERLSLVTGGEIASTFDNPESVKLGHCKLIEEIMIGDDKLIHFSGVEMGQACTIVLRGARCVNLTFSCITFCTHTQPDILSVNLLVQFL